MNVRCPYCSVTVDVVSLENHVRSMEDEDHGSQGTVPVDGVDNPWNLRLDLSDREEDSSEADTPAVEYVANEVRKGRCPACDRGILGLKGGDGFLSSGHRRLACPNCRWESPEWVEIVE